MADFVGSGGRSIAPFPAAAAGERGTGRANEAPLTLAGDFKTGAPALGTIDLVDLAEETELGRLVVGRGARTDEMDVVD